ncbi:YkgB family protein [Micromonospora avicenniae]|uniref:YkgB family protein n=1 Tax=Micromonospora avicenniae TaxID=1198245 RepID=UPI0033208843
MGTRRASADDLASVGFTIVRCGLATNILWIGALKFKQYEVQNDEPLVTSSPLFSRLRQKLGAQKLNRLIGITEITVGSLIAAKPFAPRASAIGSLGAAGMFLTTLSFLFTTPEAREEGQGIFSISQLGQFLLKDTVLLGAALLTAAESLRAARPADRPQTLSPRQWGGGKAAEPRRASVWNVVRRCPTSAR